MRAGGKGFQEISDLIVIYITELLDTTTVQLGK